MGLSNIALPSITLVLISEGLYIPERRRVIRFETPEVQDNHQERAKCLMSTFDEADEPVIALRFPNKSESTFSPEWSEDEETATVGGNNVVDSGEDEQLKRSGKPTKLFSKFLSKFYYLTGLKAVAHPKDNA